MMLSKELCWRAVTARDVRFDGLFYVGVSSTGIYCRPVCTARQPRKDNCTYFRTAAEAERAGYRACFRCRPELAPGRAPLDSISRLVEAALSKIETGFLNDHSIEDLAASLGVTSRHLRRVMEGEFGVSPVELAQSRRLALAKQLLHDTSIPLADVAHASGFQSLRRFNSSFQARFGRAPSAMRREHGDAAASRGLVLRLDFRPPMNWPHLLNFLHDRAIPGVEQVTESDYRRSVRIGKHVGQIAVRQDDQRHALRAEVSLSLSHGLMRIASRLRDLFDLDAEPATIESCLGRDEHLRGLIRGRPGLRVPGAFDSYETALRAILGQQVTIRAAATLAGRVAERFGDEFNGTADDCLKRIFPSPQRLAAASESEIASLGVPLARARAILELSRAVAAGRIDLTRRTAIEQTVRDLQALPGVGPWTAQYIAMRAIHWPDAFPAGDLGLRKALRAEDRSRLTQRAEGWRPWRAYAVMHLWASL